MGVKAKPVNMKDYKDTPKSKLSKHQYITKPENRPGLGNVGMGKAESIIRKING